MQWRYPEKKAPLFCSEWDLFYKSLDFFFSFVVVVLIAQSCLDSFETPWTVAYQAPLSMGFSRQKYWSGLPFPSPYKSLDFKC